MSDETAAPDLAAMARDVLDRIRSVVLGTIDENDHRWSCPGTGRLAARRR